LNHIVTIDDVRIRLQCTNLINAPEDSIVIETFAIFANKLNYD